MGIEIHKHEFVLSADKRIEITAIKVAIKGKREQRFNIYSLPDQTSDVVVKVPGGVNVPILKREGDWFLIKLLGGKQGYVHKNMVNIKKCFISAR